MLSSREREYLGNPEKFDSNYARVLRHRIREKVEELREEIPLLFRGDVIKSLNGITEFCNGCALEKSVEQASFNGILVRPPGFEPGSSAWQADVLTKLDYGRQYSLKLSLT